MMGARATLIFLGCQLAKIYTWIHPCKNEAIRIHHSISPIMDAVQIRGELINFHLQCKQKTLSKKVTIIFLLETHLLSHIRRDLILRVKYHPIYPT